VGGIRKRVVLAFFGLFDYDVITSTRGQNFNSKFGCVLGWNMKLKSPLIDFLAFLLPK